MKIRTCSLAPLGAVLIMTLAPSTGALFAQNAPPLSGTFGFLVYANQIDSAGATGGAILGLMNFDGAGGVTGTYTLKARTGQNAEADTVNGALSGTYTTNPDGTGAAALDFDAGFPGKFALVVTDGGKAIQFTDFSTAANTNISFQGTSSKSLTGGLPISYFIAGASGIIPISLSSSNTDGVAIYTSAPATGSGSIKCPDGSTGKWIASVPTVTAAVHEGVFTSGNFLMAISFTACEMFDFETASGLATGGPTANGYNLILRATGFLIQGSARATGNSSAPPNGSYGFQFTGFPFPAAALGVLNFDGLGNLSASFSNAGVAATFTGTYATKPDGTGTINLKGVTNPAASSVWSFVTADGGSTLLVLRVDGGANGGDVVLGTARLQ